MASLLSLFDLIVQPGWLPHKDISKLTMVNKHSFNLSETKYKHFGRFSNYVIDTRGKLDKLPGAIKYVVKPQAFTDDPKVFILDLSQVSIFAIELGETENILDITYGTSDLHYVMVKIPNTVEKLIMWSNLFVVQRIPDMVNSLRSDAYIKPLLVLPISLKYLSINAVNIPSCCGFFPDSLAKLFIKIDNDNDFNVECVKYISKINHPTTFVISMEYVTDKIISNLHFHENIKSLTIIGIKLDNWIDLSKYDHIKKLEISFNKFKFSTIDKFPPNVEILKVKSNKCDASIINLPSTVKKLDICLQSHIVLQNLSLKEYHSRSTELSTDYGNSQSSITRLWINIRPEKIFGIMTYLSENLPNLEILEIWILNNTKVIDHILPIPKQIKYLIDESADAPIYGDFVNLGTKTGNLQHIRGSGTYNIIFV